MAPEQRRLAAIVSADVVGYSRLMGRDESGTLARLRALRKQHFEPALARHKGRVVKLTGDGALVEFASAVEALAAAIEFQQAIARANDLEPADDALVFRVGLHLGDVIVEGDDLYGDGVNVAARLEGEAPPGGIVVSGDVHNAVIGRLKATFIDLGDLTLKNIDRPVRACRVSWVAADWPEVSGTTAKPPAEPPSSEVRLALPDKPSLAVLPFDNMSGDPEQAYFADGMVEDIITALSHFRSLFVIARNSSFTFKGRAIDVKQVGRELGVRYVVEGSVRRVGERIRITAQLVEAETAQHIWAGRFDGALAEVFELQDRVTTAVVAAIDPRLRHAETERAMRKPIADLTAYDLYLQALPHYHAMTTTNNAAALPLLEAAVARNPGYAQAVVMLARAIARGVWQGWQVDYMAAKRRAQELARQALVLDSSDPLVLAMAGYVLAVSSGEHDFGGKLLARAIELNPNFADGWTAAGWAAIYNGQFDLALERLAVGERLDPVSPEIAQSWLGQSVAHYFSHRFEEAITAVRRAIAAKPMHAGQRSHLIAALVEQGDIEAARAEAAALLELQPGRTLRRTRETNHYRHAWMIDMYVDGLRRAGIPE